MSSPVTHRTPALSPSRGLPPRLLPTLYIGLAHASLAVAFAVVALDPRGVAGFFYHPRMLAIVHFVTLGWITASILGALYIVGPVALRTRIPAGPLDYGAALFVATGLVGMVAHFWIEEYGGMAWSGATAGLGIVAVGLRIARPLGRARVPAAVRLHIALAFVNVTGAAFMGVLLGINRVHPFLPGFVLSNVFAHAHLAAVGWAALAGGLAFDAVPFVRAAAWSLFAATLLHSLQVALVVRRAYAMKPGERLKQPGAARHAIEDERADLQRDDGTRRHL